MFCILYIKSGFVIHVFNRANNNYTTGMASQLSKKKFFLYSLPLSINMNVRPNANSFNVSIVLTDAILMMTADKRLKF